MDLGFQTVIERLTVINHPLPDPPYPATTKANGWRPEVDLQRIHQSRTWVLCPPAYRPWLLMLWLESWASIPAGTYPADDDEMIAARIGMDLDDFTARRRALLRGWVRHSDGLLYHPYITSQVLEMLDSRATNTNRQRRFREANARRAEEAKGHVTHYEDAVTRYEAPVTHESRVSNGQDLEQEEEETNRIPGSGVEGGMGETEKPPSAAPTPAASPARVAKAERLCPLPDDLAITPELEAWAAQRGYQEPLAPHLETFREKAEMRGYRYAGRKGWTLALQKAIREDWAGLRTPHPQAHGPPASRARQIEEANRAHMRALGIDDDPDAIEGVFHREP